MRHNITEYFLYKQALFRLFSVEFKTVHRVKQYLDAKGISLNAFDKAIGAGNGYFGKQLKKAGSIGSDVVEKIICEYPDLNPSWVLTGFGDMLLPLDKSTDKNTRTYVDRYENTVASEPESANYAPPTSAKTAPATAPATHYFGHPQVITVNEKDEELVTLVSVKAAAGYLNGYADPEYIESLPTIKFPGLKGGSHRAFEVKGQSMMPTLHNSCIAIARFEESFNNIKDRRIYVIVTKYDGIVVKRVLNRIEQSGKLILLSDNQNKREYPNIIMEADEVLQIWYLRAALGFEFHEPNELYNRFNDLEAQVTILQDSIKKLIK